MKSIAPKRDTSQLFNLNSRDSRLLLKLSIVCAATISGGGAFAAKQQNGPMYQQVLQAQIKSGAYEQSLKSKMEAVSQALNRFYDKHGHLPEAGPESQELEKRLSVIAGSNACTEEKNVRTPVKITIDMSLSGLLLQDYQKLNSRYLKNDAPGTITVIHNTENYYVITGSGIDGRPMPTASKTKILVITSDEKLLTPQ